MAATRNQSPEQRLTDHDTNFIRLETKIDSNQDALMQLIQSIKDNLPNSSQEGPGINIQQHELNNHGFPHNNHHGFSRLGKIEFPKFNGMNVEGWLCKVDHFFSVDNTPDQANVRLAIIHLEDAALLWHQSFVRSKGGNIDGMPWFEYKGAIAN